MGAAIAIEHRDTHLGHDFRQAEVEGVKHVGFALFLVEIACGFEREPGTNGARSVAEEDSYVVQIATVAGLDREAAAGPHPGVHQGVMHRPGGQGHGDGKQLGTGARLSHGAITQQQYGCAAAHEFHGARAQIVDRTLEVAGWREDTIQHRQRHLVC